MGASASVLEPDKLSTDDLCNMLVSLDLPQYVDSVKSRHVEGIDLEMMDDDIELKKFLHSLGIVDETHQNMIAESFARVRSHSSKPVYKHPDSLVNMHSPTLTVEMATAELKTYPDRIEERGEITGFGEGCTPLMAACYFGNMNIVSVLLDKGADPNAASAYVSFTESVYAGCIVPP
jgi:hypothetical protein